MKISEAWLHDLVGHKLKGINIEEVLTQLGLEVDSVEPLRNDSHRNLVCCFIKEIQAHPKSDKLKICLVETVGERLLLSYVERKMCLREPRQYWLRWGQHCLKMKLSLKM